MPLTTTAALALWEGELPAHDVHLLMIFVGIIAGSLVVAAIGLVMTSVFAARLLHSVNGIAKEAKEHTGPLLKKTNELVQELAPKIHHLTENAEQISYTLRAKVDEISTTVTQINHTVQQTNYRTQAQVTRVDGIVTDALHAAEAISQTVQEGIKVPLRQVVGIVAGVKAGLEKLVSFTNFPRE